MPTCSIEGCDKRKHARGWCSMHYWRVREYGSTDLPVRERAEPTKWVTKWGYMHVYLPGHPMANSAGAVFEHRLVMANAIGRSLMADENVHHINGDRLDNRLENLELWSKAQPAGQRIEDKVAFALDILSRYRPEMLSNTHFHGSPVAATPSASEAMGDGPY